MDIRERQIDGVTSSNWGALYSRRRAGRLRDAVAGAVKDGAQQIVWIYRTSTTSTARGSAS